MLDLQLEPPHQAGTPQSRAGGDMAIPVAQTLICPTFIFRVSSSQTVAQATKGCSHAQHHGSAAHRQAA